MSIGRNRDGEYDVDGPQVDDLLRLGRIIGWRRWGMIVLYYRAGISQTEIGRIFGLRRQVVGYQMRRAVEIAAQYLAVRRLCTRRGAARRSPRRETGAGSSRH